MFLALIITGFEVFTTPETCYAETTIPFYSKTISNGKIVKTKIGDLAYTKTASYYQYSSITDKSTGILAFQESTGCSKFSIEDASGNALTIKTTKGYYITSIGQNPPAVGYVYNDYYNISYVLNGGTNNSNNPEAFDSTSGTLQLYNPTRENYAFIGWSLNDQSGEKVYQINSSSYTSDITLYANWSKLEYIEVQHVYTNGKEILSTGVDTVSFYNKNDLYYEYSSNLFDKKNELSLEKLEIYNESGELITITTHQGSYISSLSYGKPARIEIKNVFYSITYYLNDGTNHPDNINYYTQKSELLNLLDPTKDGYIFIGWYLDSEFNNVFSTSDFTESDISLYARWSQLKQLDVIYKHTDSYSIYEEKVDSVYYYLKPTNNLYYYGSNLKTKYEELNCSIFDLKSATDTIQISTHNGNYISNYSYGEPKSLVISYPFYSITYNTNDGVFDSPSMNYYLTKSELFEKISQPTKEGYKFYDWYLDAEFTSPLRTSDFEESNIVVYAKWSKLYPVEVFYYNSEEEPSDYQYVGQINYYVYLDLFYCYGELTDTSSEIGYYLNKYNTTSFSIVDKDGKRLNELTTKGKCLSTIESGTPNAVFIYNHYTVKFYVNGILYAESNGQGGEKVNVPTDLKGFIGKNYDALEIASQTIGSRYAAYLFKGWSETDTGDRSWFNQEKVDLIDTDSLKFNTDKEYVKNLYAYMLFYKKVQEKNSQIDYKKYVEETRGIIRESSKYSIDDLLLEHATEISSGTELSTVEKIAKALGLKNDHPFISFLSSLQKNTTLSIKEITENIFWKILIFSTLGLIVIFAGIFVKVYFSSLKK